MFVIIFSKKYRYLFHQILKKSYLIISILIIPIIFLVITGNSPLQFFQNFLLKGSRIEDISLYNLLLQSRGWKIAMSYDVFLDNKLLGIGFGAPTPTEYAIPYEIIKVGISEEVKITYDPIFGLPIAAPVEKGFFFTGLLEEVGIVEQSHTLYFTLCGVKELFQKVAQSIIL